MVPRLFEHDFAYIFQHPDGRIVFAMPYEHEFTLIGTTDLDYEGDLDQVAITDAEVAYLCQLSNRYFSAADHAGGRGVDVFRRAAAGRGRCAQARPPPRATSGSSIDTAAAPMLTVFGGKITTFRKLAEEAVDRIAPLLGNRSGGWTAAACLPGGDLFGGKPSNTRRDGIRPLGRGNSGGATRGCRSRSPRAMRAPTAAASRSCWRGARACTTWARKSCPACTRPKPNT